LDQISFFLQRKFSSEKKSKRRERHTENSNPTGFELHRPSLKGNKLLFKVIKAIIIDREREGKRRKEKERRMQSE